MTKIHRSLSLMLATALASAGALAAADPGHRHELVPAAAQASVVDVRAAADPITFQLQEPSMSYSLSVRAPTKAALLAAVAAKFDAEVVTPQPVHAKDRDQVLSTATAAVNLLADDDTQDVQISLSGSLSWTGTDAPGAFRGLNISVGTYLVTRQA
jgi:hypothetical protein